MKRVLVTGASGFVGYQMLEPLALKGYEVHAVARSRSGQGREDVRIHWHEEDLLDSAAVARLASDVQPTHLLHSAWFLQPGAFYESPLNFEWVRASLELLQRFREFGGRRCVMVGTGYEYDLRFGYCSEERTPCIPLTTYGRCKNALQQLLAAFSDRHGVSSAWGRLFFLYGPREYPTRLVASVATALLQGEQAACSSGEQIRDYLHVRDAANALVALLDSEIEGPVNVASGKPVSIRDVVDTVAKVIGRRELLRPGEMETSPDSPPLIVANVSRLTREVHWKPEFSLEEGVRETVNWWRSHMKSESTPAR